MNAYDHKLLQEIHAAKRKAQERHAKLRAQQKRTTARIALKLLKALEQAERTEQATTDTCAIVAS